MKHAIRLVIGIPILMIGSGCDSFTNEASPPIPEITLKSINQDNQLIEISLWNPSDTEIFVPGFEAHPSLGTFCIGSYWFDGDEVIEVPECGVGFWKSKITIPPRDEREFSISIPKKDLPEGSLTLAIVYGGHGAVSADELPTRPKGFSNYSIRHPDLMLNCRKVEALIALNQKIQAEQGSAR